MVDGKLIFLVQLRQLVERKQSQRMKRTVTVASVRAYHCIEI